MIFIVNYLLYVNIDDLRLWCCGCCYNCLDACPVNRMGIGGTGNDKNLEFVEIIHDSDCIPWTVILADNFMFLVVT